MFDIRPLAMSCHDLIIYHIVGSMSSIPVPCGYRRYSKTRSSQDENLSPMGASSLCALSARLLALNTCCRNRCRCCSKKRLKGSLRRRCFAVVLLAVMILLTHSKLYSRVISGQYRSLIALMASFTRPGGFWDLVCLPLRLSTVKNMI